MHEPRGDEATTAGSWKAAPRGAAGELGCPGAFALTRTLSSEAKNSAGEAGFMCAHRVILLTTPTDRDLCLITVVLGRELDHCFIAHA